jgi:hypothetical protein
MFLVEACGKTFGVVALVTSMSGLLVKTGADACLGNIVRLVLCRLTNIVGTEVFETAGTLGFDHVLDQYLLP